MTGNMSVAGRCLALCLGATILSTAAAAQSLTPDLYRSLAFRHIGPPGNRVNAIAGVAGDPNVIYAGTPSGGIFKSEDAGLHWRPIFDGQIVASIGALAVSRSNPQVVWAGTGDPNIRPNIEIGNGVYKSTDAWEDLVAHGARQNGPHRARRHRPAQREHRVRGRHGTLLWAAGGTRRLPHDGRRCHLEARPLRR
jgi:hypothetical protein